jgi:hypothetical protein
MSIEDVPGHAAYRATISKLAEQNSHFHSFTKADDVGPICDCGARALFDTPTLNEPASSPQPETVSDAGSPSAVRQHEIEMTLLLTKINQELPDALSALQRAKDKVRSLKLEKLGAERLLATHHRLNNPRRRKVSQ